MIFTNNAGSTAHGFAAEQGNNLIDVLKGYRARVVGGDNAKNKVRKGNLSYKQAVNLT